MAGTHKLIGSVTVSAGSQAAIEFTSIPQTYTDLLVKLSIRQTKPDGYSEITVKFNGSSTNFTMRALNAAATAVDSYNSTTAYVGSALGTTANGGTSVFSNNEIYLPNYTSSNYKSYSAESVAERNFASFNNSSLITGLWSNTAAITSLLFESPGYYIEQYSTAYLYGIEIPAQQITPKATGGDITFNDTHVIHTFRQSGTFTPLQSLTADYLVVAGGGGGGGQVGGGGGAGGYRHLTSQSLTAQAYTVTVGAGGAGSTASGGAATSTGLSGSNSVFGSTTSSGGGGGASYNAYFNGLNGGSGGGGAYNSTPTAGTAGSGNAGSYSPVEGYAGGVMVPSASGAAGGGGGSSAVGNNTSGSVGGAGGAGTANSITGTSVTYAGGGGGCSNTGAGAAGGAGGGGSGGVDVTVASTAGTTNTGGGGGGQRDAASSVGSAGGSGIVIVRYLK